MPDDFVTYIFIAALIGVVIMGLMRYLSRRNRPPRPALRSFEEKANRAGADGRQDGEEKMKAMFEDFRRKENSL